MKLPYKDWEKLDELLSRHGWGGYYDLVEALKDVAGHIGFNNTGIDLHPEGSGPDLPQMVQYLQDWADILSREPGFLELTEKAAEDVERIKKEILR